MDISLGPRSDLPKMAPVTPGASTNWSSVTTDTTERDVANIATRSFQHSPCLTGGAGSPLPTARDFSPPRVREYSMVDDSSMDTPSFLSPLTVGAALDREPTPSAAIPAGPQTPNASTGACSPKDDLDDPQFVDMLGAIAAPAAVLGVNKILFTLEGRPFVAVLDCSVGISEEKMVSLQSLLEEFCVIQYMGAPIPDNFSLRLDLEFKLNMFVSEYAVGSIPLLATRVMELESRLVANDLKILAHSAFSEKDLLDRERQELLNSDVARAQARVLELAAQIKVLLGSVVAKIMPA